MSNELLPCPLCNEPMVLEQFVDWEEHPLPVKHIVHRNHPTCPLARIQTEATPEAIAAWNRRPTLSDEAVERAARAIYALDPYGNGAVGDVPWDELDSGRYHEGADHKATCLAQARDALTAAFSPAPESAPSGAAMIDAMPDAEFDRDRSLENPTVGKLTKPAPSSPVPVEAVGWQPIETMKGDGPAWFWLDWADDCAKLNPPMSWDSRERIHYGTRGSWVSVYKATHWRVLDGPKKLIAEVMQ